MILRTAGMVAALMALLMLPTEATARAGWGYRPGAGHAFHQYRPMVRPGYGYGHGYGHGYGYGWRRPNYRWRPGAAIAAGAAIGFLTAGAAAAIAASAAPAPGLCWYYTNPARTAGFWDQCP